MVVKGVREADPVAAGLGHWGVAKQERNRGGTVCRQGMGILNFRTGRLRDLILCLKEMFGRERLDFLSFYSMAAGLDKSSVSIDAMYL